MKFNYQLSFNFEGKNNHNFSNNEIKLHFFLFFVQKSCCVFAQFKKLLYICGKIRTCGRTQQNCLILIVVCAQLGSTCDVLSIVAPRRGSLYNKYTRGNQTRNAKKQWPKKSESRILPRELAYPLEPLTEFCTTAQTCRNLLATRSRKPSRK